MKFCTILFCIFLFGSVHAQTLPYTFSVANAAYSPLTGATSVNDGEPWDDFNFLLPLGFDFKLYGQTMSSILYYGDITNNAFVAQTDPTPILFSYGSDLFDRGYNTSTSVSPISYKTEGLPGSRIFKMEWANAGFYEDLLETSFVNTQTWFFEGSNNIELHFGPSQINTPEVFGGFTGPVFGFVDVYSTTQEYFDNMWYLSGPVNNPTVKKIAQIGFDTLVYTVNGTPTNGLVYRFSPTTSGLHNIRETESEIRVFPTIASNKLTLELSNNLASNERDIQYEIIDQLGNTVQHASITGTLSKTDISGLPSGLYYIKVRSSNGILATKKVVKQ